MSSTINTMIEPEAASAHAEPVELDQFRPRVPGGGPLLAPRPRLFDSIQVALSVVVGEAQSTVGELMSLQEQSILTIDRGLNSPVDIVVNGNVVARGELVAVDEHFGVRITEIAEGMRG
jgi:flagellar motor switch protein FliN/FliY